MNPREYSLVNYGYFLAKQFIGFLAFILLFGPMMGVPVWACLMVPFFVVGTKLTFQAVQLLRNQRTGKFQSGLLGNADGVLILVFLAVVVVSVALKWLIPFAVCAGLMGVFVLLGLLSCLVIFRYPDYRMASRRAIIEGRELLKDTKSLERAASRAAISQNEGVTSKKQGFAYMNELFVKRHKKILWGSSVRLALIVFAVAAVFCTVLLLLPEERAAVNEGMMQILPFSVFLMFCINRGSGFTQALFMNCDHSMLTFAFYKKPKSILKLFQIRLIEIIKVNLVPAVVIGAGLDFVLFLTGGTEEPVNYAIIFVSIMALSVFFSVHYLTVYYLLQPYTAQTEAKNPVYTAVTTVTYLSSLYVNNLELSNLVFGLAVIAFCVLYCVIACILVYLFAPRTFRLRQG